MTVWYILGALVVAGLLAYLLVTLLDPEAFE
jgi:K+-transporting ATPase KdpF subunit